VEVAEQRQQQQLQIQMMIFPHGIRCHNKQRRSSKKKESGKILQAKENPNLVKRKKMFMMLLPIISKDFGASR